MKQPLDTDLASSSWGLVRSWVSCVVVFTLLVLLGSIWMLEKEDMALPSSTSFTLLYVLGTIIVLGFWQKMYTEQLKETKMYHCFRQINKKSQINDRTMGTQIVFLSVNLETLQNSKKFLSLLFHVKVLSMVLQKEQTLRVKLNGKKKGFTREEFIGIEEGSRGGMSLRLMMTDLLLLDVFRFDSWSSSIFFSLSHNSIRQEFLGSLNG